MSAVSKREKKTVAKRLEPYMIQDARILFLNFSGEERQYNLAGNRNFVIDLRPEDAETLIRDGWNVKIKDPYEDGDDPDRFLKVKVSFKNRAPYVCVVGDITKRQTVLDEGLVGMLDIADIVKVDLIISPYSWDINDKQGVTAYLKTIYVTVAEDPLQIMYNRMLQESTVIER